MTAPAKTRSDILARMESRAVALGDFSQFEECKYVGVDAAGRPVKQPRWKVGAKWIEFECGCRAERVDKLVSPKPWDPIIFVGLPEQAVYDSVCWQHEPSMNKRLMRHYVDFAQWRRNRRDLLIGR